jgi:hypothetical protein
VLPDADAPGKRHAKMVASGCAGWRPTPPLPAATNDPAPDVALAPDDPEAAPLVARVLPLPGLASGEDVYDWLTAHGHTGNDLRAIIASATPWMPDDPAARRRAQTRERVRRWRARQRVERPADGGAA